jgi:hypothetical protein
MTFNSATATPAEMEAKVIEIDRRNSGAVPDPDLERMNQRYAVVKVGGKTRVVSLEDGDAYAGSRLPVFSTIPDFCAFHANPKKEIPGSLKRIGIGKWWIEHENRRQYDGIVYAPDGDCGSKFNLWTGFAYEPKSGNCGLFLKHVRDNICSGNDEHAAYLIGWMASAVQNPGKPGEVAVVLRGREGTGKGIFAKEFGLSLFALTILLRNGRYWH